MLTAVTSILGMVPMALGVSYDFISLRGDMGGESAQWWGQMASAFIFGLSVSSLLILVVPCSSPTRKARWPAGKPSRPRGPLAGPRPSEKLLSARGINQSRMRDGDAPRPRNLQRPCLC